MLKHAKKVEVVRASDVKFDNTTGKWAVNGCIAETREALSKLGFFGKRRDAIAAEVDALTTMLRGK